MKRLFSIFLVVTILCVVGVACAEDWSCQSCGTISAGNFCSNCGTAKPAEDWICPQCNDAAIGKFCSNCGTARPSSVTLSTVADATSVKKEDPEELKAVIKTVLKPISDGTISSFIDMGNGTFSVSMNNGDSYMGLITESDDSYTIEIMNYSSSDYSSISNPYDYQNQEFKSVLNYLLRNKGATVTALIPLLGDICTVQDSAGDSYMLTVLVSPSMATVGLLGF